QTESRPKRRARKARRAGPTSERAHAVSVTVAATSTMPASAGTRAAWDSPGTIVPAIMQAIAVCNQPMTIGLPAPLQLSRSLRLSARMASGEKGKPRPRTSRANHQSGRSVNGKTIAAAQASVEADDMAQTDQATAVASGGMTSRAEK